MALEAVASTSDDMLVPGLSYSLSQAASYITGRRTTSWYASGSDLYSYSTGQQVMKFNISDVGGALLDLSTVRLCFVLSNTHASLPLQLTGQWPLCTMYRMRIFLGGQLIEDVQQLHRQVAMLKRLMPVQRNWSESTEGLGGAESGTYSGGSTMDAIAANSSRTVLDASSRVGPHELALSPAMFDVWAHRRARAL